MKYQSRKQAMILLADGTIFYGKAVANKEGSAFGEVCFNTGMTGYQEIFTDPSYYGQLMVTTNAHIGNYGVKNDEEESDSVKIAGLICKNFSYVPSRVGKSDSLENFLNENKFSFCSANDLKKMNLIDGIIKEPLGGAHNDVDFAADKLKKVILSEIEKLEKIDPEKRILDRVEKFSLMGVTKND